MQYHSIPVIKFQFFRNMSRNIVIYFRKVLTKFIQLIAIYNFQDSTDRNEEA
jgi:hypothetical protein